MSRRTPPRPSATARSRFFLAGSCSASAARANAAASASTVESAEGQVPSSLHARSVTPQIAFPSTSMYGGWAVFRARTPAQSWSLVRPVSCASANSTASSPASRRRSATVRIGSSRGAHVLWGSATNERRIGASPQRCQAQRCPFSAQTAWKPKSAKSVFPKCRRGRNGRCQATRRHVRPPPAMSP